MATNEIPSPPSEANRKIAGAYWEGAMRMEDLALSLERLRETAFALSASETYDSGAQHAFYSLGELADVFQRRAKANEDHLTELSAQYRGVSDSQANRGEVQC